MRLARLAVAGLAIGVLAGFIAALLRPRPRVVDDTAGSGTVDLTQATGEPLAWGERKPTLPPLVPVVPKARGAE